MTASGLRREADRGRLIVERIAGKDYTTLQAIADMRRLCRMVKPQPGVSVSSYRGESQEVAQARALAKLRALRSKDANAKWPNQSTGQTKRSGRWRSLLGLHFPRTLALPQIRSSAEHDKASWWFSAG
jgi:hypothetical protein